MDFLLKAEEGIRQEKESGGIGEAYKSKDDGGEKDIKV